jgi:hypothetical protein
MGGGHAVAELAEAICYKPEGRGFDSRYHWIFNPSSRTMALGSTQPLRETRTRNLPGGKGQPARKADLNSICEPIAQKNVGASTSHKPMGLHGLLQGELYLLLSPLRIKVTNSRWSVQIPKLLFMQYQVKDKITYLKMVKVGGSKNFNEIHLNYVECTLYI